jgi:SCY1-like protein 2
MTLIKSVSSRIEQEHSRKLQDLSSNSMVSERQPDFMSFGSTGGQSGATNGQSSQGGGADDFESLVLGKKATNGGGDDMLNGGWDSAPMQPSRGSSSSTVQPAAAKSPTFSWSTPSPSVNNSAATLRSQPTIQSRTVTPDQRLGGFAALTPSTPSTNMGFAQAQQPNAWASVQPMQPQQPVQQQPTSVDWGAAASNPWGSNAPALTPARPTMGNSMGSMNSMNSSMSSMSFNSTRPAATTSSSFSLPPPPASNSPWAIPPPAPANNNPSYGGLGGLGGMANSNLGQQQTPFGAGTGLPQNQGKSGLDAYESLL